MCETARVPSFPPTSHLAPTTTRTAQFHGRLSFLGHPRAPSRQVTAAQHLVPPCTVEARRILLLLQLKKEKFSYLSGENE